MSLCVGGDAFTVPASENSAVGVTGSETLSQHCGDVFGPCCSLCLPRRMSVRAEVGQARRRSQECAPSQPRSVWRPDTGRETLVLTHLMVPSVGESGRVY